MAGVDVGEDFLDVALLRIESRTLQHHRIALGEIENDALGALRQRVSSCWPAVDTGWLALIDSPRSPRDLDCSRGIAARRCVPASRELDRALRERLRAPAAARAIRLSMFPTPVLAYFRQCVVRSDCKPHLRAIYRQLFDAQAVPESAGEGRLAGGSFTRFMLAGFLAFRAWEGVGAHTLEAYPELQYRLCGGERIASKRHPVATVRNTRVEVIMELRRELAIAASPPPANLHQADAEILALSAARAMKHNSLAALEHPAEGRFLLTF